MCHFVEFEIERLFHGERFLDVVVEDVVVLDGHDAIALALEQEVDGFVAHLAGKHAVTKRGRAAALHVAQNGVRKGGDVKWQWVTESKRKESKKG